MLLPVFNEPGMGVVLCKPEYTFPSVTDKPNAGRIEVVPLKLPGSFGHFNKCV